MSNREAQTSLPPALEFQAGLLSCWASGRRVPVGVGRVGARDDLEASLINDV